MSEPLDIFQTGTREAVRFSSTKGNLAIEDLWQLPLESEKGVSLDSVAIQCNRELKALTEESFVKTRTAQNTTAQLKLDIVKHIIQVRQQENAATRATVERKAQKDKILRIMASKQDAALENSSLEDLQAMLEKL